MNRIIPLFLLLIAITASCENDFYEDYDCKPAGGGDIGGWASGDSTNVEQNKDTISGFAIKVKNWEDTVMTDIVL